MAAKRSRFLPRICNGPRCTTVFQPRHAADRFCSRACKAAWSEPVAESVAEPEPAPEPVQPATPPVAPAPRSARRERKVVVQLLVPPATSGPAAAHKALLGCPSCWRKFADPDGLAAHQATHARAEEPG